MPGPMYSNNFRAANERSAGCGYGVLKPALSPAGPPDKGGLGVDLPKITMTVC